jgi:hypothetical protein
MRVYLDNGMVPGPVRTARKKQPLKDTTITAVVADTVKEQRWRKPTEKAMEGAFITDSVLLRAGLEGLDNEMERRLVQTMMAVCKDGLKGL